jgi:hypothetical protein
LQVEPEGQQTGSPLLSSQQTVSQRGPVVPRTGVYSQVWFAPVQAPVWQVLTAQSPQSTRCPQLLVTVPHFGF